MGLFGGSSSSKTTQSQTGSQTQLGDPVSISISGKKNTAQVYNTVEVTDFGAVSAALNLAENVASRDNQLSRAEIDSAERHSRRILDSTKAAISSNERAAGRILDSTGDFSKLIVGSSERFGGRILDVSESVLSQATAQNQQFSGAVSNLTAGFQEFVNRENNPGERVNIYLIVGAATVAALFLFKGK